MKKFIYFTVLLFLVLIPKYIVKADCTYSEITRLQKIANNVNISYLFDENTKKFTVTILNLKKSIEIKDMYNNKVYNTDGEVNIKNVSSGKYTFKIYAKDKECMSYEIISKNINMPFYNEYYENDECNDFKDKYYCLKWLKSDVGYSEWNSNVKKYKKVIVEEKETVNDTFIQKIFKQIQEIYSKYYYIILPIFILMLFVIIYRNNKKNSLV